MTSTDIDNIEIVEVTGPPPIIEVLLPGDAPSIVAVIPDYPIVPQTSPWSVRQVQLVHKVRRGHRVILVPTARYRGRRGQRVYLEQLERPPAGLAGSAGATWAAGDTRQCGTDWTGRTAGRSGCR